MQDLYKVLNSLFFFILISSVVIADNLVESYNDPVTFSVGDLRWCKRFGVCTFSMLTVDNIIVQNLSVIGDVFNVTMNLVTWNITDNFNVGGNLFAKNISADCITLSDGTKFCNSYSAGIFENSTRVIKAKSSQDMDMQDGDIIIKDLDNEQHSLSRDLQTLDEISRNITLTGLDGTLDLETSNVTVTTLSGDNIVVNIDTTETILNSNQDSIIITSGTNESPILNQIIYINAANPTLSKRTTLGLKAPSVAAFLQGDNFTYVSAIGLATIDGLVGGLFNRFFRDGSTYRSGFDINVSTNMVNISTGVISFLFSEIDIIQNHSTSDLYVHVHSDGSFHQHFDLSECISYNDGSTISNNKYAIFVIGMAITHDGAGVMYVVSQDKPSTEYTKAIDAEVDLEDTVNFFPPDDLVSLAYIPIVKVIIRRSGGVNTIQTLSNGALFDDLRGTVTKTSSSPPPSGITSYDDLTEIPWTNSGTDVILTDIGDNVGIGTTTPSESLEVIGNSIFDGNINKTGILFPNDRGVSSEGLVGYWSLNGNAKDFSGEGNDGIVSGANVTSEGRFGSAFEFDGVDNGDDITISNFDNITNINFSYCLWAKPRVLQLSRPLTTGTSVDASAIEFQSDQDVQFFIVNKSGTVKATTASSVYNVGEWINVCGTKNGSHINIYINGQFTSGGSIPDTEFRETNRVTIGESKSVATRNFNGTIDEVMIFNRSLSSDEIKSLYERNKEMISQSAYYTKDVSDFLFNTTEFLTATQIDNSSIIRNINGSWVNETVDNPRIIRNNNRSWYLDNDNVFTGENNFTKNVTFNNGSTVKLEGKNTTLDLSDVTVDKFQNVVQVLGLDVCQIPDTELGGVNVTLGFVKNPSSNTGWIQGCAVGGSSALRIGADGDSSSNFKVTGTGGVTSNVITATTVNANSLFSTVGGVTAKTSFTGQGIPTCSGPSCTFSASWVLLGGTNYQLKRDTSTIDNKENIRIPIQNTSKVHELTFYEYQEKASIQDEQEAKYMAENPEFIQNFTCTTDFGNTCPLIKNPNYIKDYIKNRDFFMGLIAENVSKVNSDWAIPRRDEKGEIIEGEVDGLNQKAITNAFRVEQQKDHQRIDDLEKENQMLKDELCLKDNTYSWC